MKKVKINGQFDIILPNHRADRPEWFTKEGWEKKRLASMHENIGEGDTVFYVGSEEGEMPALCQMWGAQVAMFEPNPKVWPNSRVIWEANKLDNPLACFVGFASNKTALKGEPIHINMFPKCAEGKVIGNHGFKELAYEADNFPQITIDDFVSELGITPTALSIDVEGSEFEVLKGAEWALKEYHPKIWLSLHPEFMFRMFGHYQFDLRRWIKDLGYKETLLDYQHEVHLLYEEN